MPGNENFIMEQQKAVQRMMEMNRRSQRKDGQHNMPPAPSFVKLPENNFSFKEQTPLSEESKRDIPRSAPETPKNGLSLPFLDGFKIDRDTTLILGLLLILWSEKSDRYLLFALLYILL